MAFHAGFTSMNDLARALGEEARATGERRVLVLTGSPDATREAARNALSDAEVSLKETTVVGSNAVLDCEQFDPVHARNLLGRTRTAVVLDCHEAFRPNALGASVGAVDGGGHLLLLVPPLDEWPGQRDEFDETFAVPPFAVEDVTGNFRTRVVETLRAHPGIAIYDVDAGEVRKDGLTDPAPRFASGRPEPPESHAFSEATYDACLTDDQVTAVHAFQEFQEVNGSGTSRALVVESDRGRGKSSAAGLAAASLALAGSDVLVTAPQYKSAREVFARAVELLEGEDALGAIDHEDAPQCLEVGSGATGGRVRFALPTQARDLPEDPDVVIVDEAAALPVRILERFLDASNVAFTTTVHGYEGAGRGFSVRFRDRLAESDHEVREMTMTTPIRYAAGDPVETWAFRALLLDARPAVDRLVADATVESAEYQRLDSSDLLDDEHLLRELFGLLVLAHYRTEPGDLARLLDAPNVTVRALTHDGHVVSVALLAREGDLPADLRDEMYAGKRVRGNMIPDVLTTQLRDEAGAIPVGQRVLRIATHPAVQDRGLGSKLHGEIHEEFAESVDWIGVGYGTTPELVRFWDRNGYDTVHLSTTRNDASGEYSAIMIDSCSSAGADLAQRHGEWFLDRVASVLSDPVDDLNADVARAVLTSASGTPPLDISEWEWRVLAGVPSGATTFDTNPDPFRRLALRHLVDPTDTDALSDRAERVLVRKVLQGHEWEAVGEEFDFISTAECMRFVARTVERLVRLYGDDLTM